jgi:hypothetical protein
MELLRKVVDGAGHLQAVVAILQQRAPELRNFIAAHLFVKRSNGRAMEGCDQAERLAA